MHFRSIQALRAVAALLVIAHHLTDRRFVSGAAGVDVFFVISGFIMGSLETSVSPGQFILKRMIRIVPLYWLATIAMCFGAVAGIFTRFNFDANSLIKSLLFIPYFDMGGNIWPLVIPGWTLNAELMFYVIFALGLWFRVPRAFSAVGITAIFLIGLVFTPKSAPLHFWSMPIMLEFIAGLALATLIRPSGLSKGMVLIAVGVAAFVFAEIGWHYTEALRPLAWGGPAMLIVCGALAIERAGHWPERALIPLEKIGDVSYSLYLIHGFIVVLLHRKLGISFASTIVAIPLCFGVAFAIYFGFERPVGKALSRLLISRRLSPERLPVR